MYDWLFGTMDVYLAAGGEAGYIEMGRKANAAARRAECIGARTTFSAAALIAASGPATSRAKLVTF